MDGDDRPRVAAPASRHAATRVHLREGPSPSVAGGAHRPSHARGPVLPRPGTAIPLPLAARDLRALEEAFRRALDRRPGRVPLAASSARRRACLAPPPGRPPRRGMGGAARERSRPRLRARPRRQRRLGGDRARPLGSERRSLPSGSAALRRLARAGPPRTVPGTARRHGARRPQGPRHASRLRAGFLYERVSLLCGRRGASVQTPRRPPGEPFHSTRGPGDPRAARGTGGDAELQRAEAIPRRLVPRLFR